MSSRTRSAPVTAAERRNARQHARGLQRQREQRRKQIQLAMWIGIGVAIVAVVGVLIFRGSQSMPGRAMPIQGNSHINKGEQHIAYNSKPATSGPHWNIGGEAPVSWGIYKEQQADEATIHNLEHGGIGIAYNCRDCPDLVAQIEGFYNTYTSDPAHRLPLYPSSTKLVVEPYYDMTTRIALTAWGRIDTMDTWDAERVTKFIEAYRDKGPEKTP